MELSHDDVVAFAQTFGLIYLMVIFVGATVYAFWPSLGPRFDRAARSVLDDEEGPRRGGGEPWR